MRNLLLLLLFFTLLFKNISAQQDCDVCNNLTIITSDESTTTGDCLCIPFITYNFNDIQTLQFGLSWDASKLSFKSFMNQGISPLLNTNNSSLGQLIAVWFDGTGVNPITLNNGSTLFEVCYDVIAPACDVVPTPGLDEGVLITEASSSVGNVIPTCVLGSNIYIGDIDNCEFCISNHGVLCAHSKVD